MLPMFCDITLKNSSFKLHMRNATELRFFGCTIYQTPRLFKLLSFPLDFAIESLINYPGFFIINYLDLLIVLFLVP